MIPVITLLVGLHGLAPQTTCPPKKLTPMLSPLNCAVLKALNISRRSWILDPSPKKLSFNQPGAKFL